MSDAAMTGSGGQSSRRCPRWLGIGLVLSLGANLLVGGIYLGEQIRKMEHDRGYAERVVQYLPEERREAALAVLGSDTDDRRAMRPALLAATRDVAAALTAEPFEPEALQAAMLARMDVYRERFLPRIERLVALAEMLTPAERVLLAEGMVQREERKAARKAGR
ncbi:hypothetical protein LNKW23_31090 [Paralimibaculum aggregatum]|uniref:Zinc resistance-associated protein n=1 Tax=Paralimibaculum aggregatum TaxID=3036245 RepID=A0ABQ6LKY1_9RHOB|nr:periplasmic heavy metal sensor [Limibaculum sp. NKW23]GMG83895.1 hypothetical protein LNKW23_31090 [Limibaculum sp. NKW23]